jgi:hypothetical protein
LKLSREALQVVYEEGAKLAMNEKIRKVEQPTAALVRKYLDKWQTLEKYKLQEESLKLLFQDLCPRNDDLSHILLKVSALNDFYSTNIFDTYSVAKRILADDPSARILEGDISLVNELARVQIGGKDKNFYSFASKYCYHHNPEEFPIYDSYVDKMLRHFSRTDGFAELGWNELKIYERFVGIVQDFRKHYRLDEFSLREIDIYLWLVGKDAFSKVRGDNQR